MTRTCIIAVGIVAYLLTVVSLVQALVDVATLEAVCIQSVSRLTIAQVTPVGVITQHLTMAKATVRALIDIGTRGWSVVNKSLRAGATGVADTIIALCLCWNVAAVLFGVTWVTCASIFVKLAVFTIPSWLTLTDCVLEVEVARGRSDLCRVTLPVTSTASADY